MLGKLYFNKSDKRVVDKTITQVGGNMDIQFIDDSSVVDPILKMKVTSGILNCNYLWLEDLHRYYYINDWTLSKGYVIAKCHVDVLMTYKTEIREIKCIVRRQERYDRCNFYQNDDKWKLNSYPCTRVLEFDSGFDMSNNNFVMGVVGDV